MWFVIKVLILAAVLYGLVVAVGFGIGPTEMLALLAIFAVGLVAIGYSERRRARTSAENPGDRGPE